MVRAPTIDKNGRKKGAWSEDEDNKLRAYVTRYGHWNWRELPKYAGLSRCGKSCRLRWVNYLRPNIKLGSYTKEEDDLIIKLHDQLGNKWSAIAAKLPGRSDNEIKNHWHTRLGKCSKPNITISNKQSSIDSVSEAVNQNEQKPSCEESQSKADQKEQQSCNESVSEADQKKQSSPFKGTLNGQDYYTETTSLIKRTTPEDYSWRPSSIAESSSSLSSSDRAVFYTSNSTTESSSSSSSSSLSSVFDWVREDSMVSSESIAGTMESFWSEPFLIRESTDEYMVNPLVNDFLSPSSHEEYWWPYDHDGFLF